MFWLCGIRVRGEIQLYDMYIGEEWLGSRATVAQCERFVGKQVAYCMVQDR